MVLAAPFWVLTAGIVLTSLGVGRYAFLVDKRYDQNMSSYWAGTPDVLCRHMSVYARGARYGGDNTPPVYIDHNTSLSRSDIVTMRTSLQNFADSGRVSGSSGKGGLDEDGRPVGWEDCFSSFLWGTAESVADPLYENDFTFSSSCSIVAIEGNFAAFHPFRYMSGGFLPEVPVDERQIVINDVLAWKFYKSYDVLGEKIKLWGEEFTIIGVVAEPSDRITNSCGADEPRVYVYFTAMEQLAPLTSPDSEPGNSGSVTAGGATPTPSPAAQQGAGASAARPVMAVMCYEAMIPEAIEGVARNDVSASVPNYNPVNQNFYVISNTGRYGVLTTWKFMWPIGKNTNMLSKFEFPFWEKTAQLATTHMFADEILTIAGACLLVTGSLMAALRYRKMSRK